MLIFYFFTAVILGGVLTFLVTGVLGIFGKRERLRANSRKIAWVLACLMVACWAAGFVYYRMLFGPPPPTLAELVRSFPHDHSNLEAIVALSDQDAGYGRIAPDFTWPDGLPQPRWTQYRSLYKRSHIRLGLTRNEAGDVFIMVESEGLLDRGHASGYLFCRPLAPRSVEPERRFEPCVSSEEKGEAAETGSKEAYQFIKLADNWFAYDQGPG